MTSESGFSNFLLILTIIIVSYGSKLSEKEKIYNIAFMVIIYAGIACTCLLHILMHNKTQFCLSTLSYILDKKGV